VQYPRRNQRPQLFFWPELSQVEVPIASASSHTDVGDCVVGAAVVGKGVGDEVPVGALVAGQFIVKV